MWELLEENDKVRKSLEATWMGEQLLQVRLLDLASKNIRIPVQSESQVLKKKTNHISA